jgi:hypothetical protein
MLDGLRSQELKEQQVDLTGSVFGFDSISGLNVFANGSLIANRINNANGALLPASVGNAAAGSPGLFGAFVQAGVTGQLLAATGSIIFGRAFSNGSFVVTVTPQVSGTLYPYVVSGTGTYSTSGITIGGQSGLAYNWIAVGL